MDKTNQIGQIAGYIFQYGIPAFRQIVEIVHKPDPTLADWNAALDLAESNAKIFLEETKSLVPKP